MEAKETIPLFVGQLFGRAIQEGSELIPTEDLWKKVIRGVIGIGEVIAAIKAKAPKDIETILAVSGSKILSDEVVDIILELFSKPAGTPATAPVTVTVPPATVKTTKPALY